MSGHFACGRKVVPRTYNAPMRTTSFGFSPAAAALSALFALAATGFGAAVHAQQPATADAVDAAAPRLDGSLDQQPGTDKKIERIRIEDEGVRIDELRYGGETQNITVAPKFGAPEYQVVPRDAARQRLDTGRDNSGIGTSGQRVWKVFGF